MRPTSQWSLVASVAFGLFTWIAPDDWFSPNTRQALTIIAMVVLCASAIGWIVSYIHERNAEHDPGGLPDLDVRIQQTDIGNLRHRARTLSAEIAAHLTREGWGAAQDADLIPGMRRSVPTAEPAMTAWVDCVSEHFRWRFMRRIVEIHHEFATLHIRDQELDDFMEQQVTLNRFLPQQIERVSERLVVLASVPFTP